jgi:hypothetical protein
MVLECLLKGACLTQPESGAIVHVHLRGVVKSKLVSVCKEAMDSNDMFFTARRPKPASSTPLRL